MRQHLSARRKRVAGGGGRKRNSVPGDYDSTGSMYSHTAYHPLSLWPSMTSHSSGSLEKGKGKGPAFTGNLLLTATLRGRQYPHKQKSPSNNVDWRVEWLILSVNLMAGFINTTETLDVEEQKWRGDTCPECGWTERTQTELKWECKVSSITCLVF